MKAFEGVGLVFGNGLRVNEGIQKRGGRAVPGGVKLVEDGEGWGEGEGEGGREGGGDRMPCENGGDRKKREGRKRMGEYRKESEDFMVSHQSN
jgi:hypothetical protein